MKFASEITLPEGREWEADTSWVMRKLSYLYQFWDPVVRVYGDEPPTKA